MPNETVAVIGAGTTGCWTALMLAKNPSVKKILLLEANPVILADASCVAKQIHIGGEYPKDLETALACLRYNLAERLLLPDVTHRKLPGMKFLITGESHDLGLKDHTERDGLTLEAQYEAYEQIRVQYEQDYRKIKKVMGWSDKQAERELLGPYAEGKFFHPLRPEDYQDFYSGVVGGIQTQERGRNLPVYLTMIQKALERSDKIEILCGHKVKPGIDGELGDFKIHCENGKTVGADLVVMAAWSRNPEITPHLENRVINAYERRMLVVRLPKGEATPPNVFYMKGDSGGMLSPFNEEWAFVYIPHYGAAYSSECILDNENPSLPEGFAVMSDVQKKIKTAEYLAAAKKRFPKPLVNVKEEDAYIVSRVTLNMDNSLDMRRHEQAFEVPAVGAKAGLSLQPDLHLGLEMQRVHGPSVYEVKPGISAVYATKGTYALGAGLEAAVLVGQRMETPWVDNIMRINLIDYILNHGMNKYSQKDLEIPSVDEVAKFCETHPDLRIEMAQDSFREKTPSVGSWTGFADHSRKSRTR